MTVNKIQYVRFSTKSEFIYMKNCVVFVSGELTPSQYPVFTIYLQKTCLASAGSCKAAWSFERVMEHSLAVEPLETAEGATDRQACMEACLVQPLCR